MVPVSRLPDLCLLALFRQMTLEDQIDARKVCRRWANLVPEATLKRRELILLLGRHYIKRFEGRIDKALFNSRHSLKLLLKADGTPLYPTRRLTSWNSLRLDSLDQAVAEEIANTFTGANKLQVTVLDISPSSVDSIAYLLELWSGQLISLQIFENYCWYIIDKPSTTHLFAAINSLSILKHLHLNLRTLKVPDLSIISELEELRFYSDRTAPKQFVQWLQQYGDGNRDLAQIDYHTNYRMMNLEPFTALREHLRQRFTRLDSILSRDLASLCGHFCGLTTLALSPRRITLRHLFTHLATLHQLIYLNLIITPDPFSADDQHHHHLLPQVKSVKALQFVLSDLIPIHQQLAQLKLPWTVPNVEVIRFEFHFECTECNIGTFRQPSEQAKSCLRQLFTPLKRDCTKLRLIQHDKERVHGTADELLTE